MTRVEQLIYSVSVLCSSVFAVLTTKQFV